MALIFQSLTLLIFKTLKKNSSLTTCTKLCISHMKSNGEAITKTTTIAAIKNNSTLIQLIGSNFDTT